MTLEGLGFPLHAVRLTDLAPATAYEYRIGESGRWHGFRTASDSTVRALVFTDTQSKGLFKTWKRIYRAALKQQPGADFSTVLGDLVDMGAKLGYWED
ncbi:MAG: fibronectin type III domain-containing protein [Mesosutterella sp.]|nr:fibronectin type III domain-containing protein [Mesosutterella sp.]